MNSDMKGMIRDTLVLFVITLAAGLTLGIIYQVTKEPIAEQAEKTKQEACREVFSDAASFEQLASDTEEALMAENNTPQNTAWLENGYGEVEIGEVMKAAAEDGEELGYVITVTDHEGYSGDIQFLMGIRSDGTLNGISLLSIAETAGLGMRAEEVLKPQFQNRKVEAFEYTKSGAMGDSQVDAIGGATITTHAVTNGVNAGLYYFRTVLTGGGDSNE